MFARRKLAKRFSLLLLEDEEDYVADWAASCKWPSNVEGNWQGLASLPGRLRLCTKSLFFEPDDVRVPIVRLEFASVVQLEAEGAQACVVGVNKVTKMKPNMADVPYTVERHKPSSWVFSLTYAKLDSFMPLAQEQLVISRLPAADRLQLQDAAVKAREDAAAFDTSRLVEFSERLLWEGPALQLSPLVREPGRLAVTDQRLYFQPLHNIAGDTPVRSHPLAAVAAVVRRRSCLAPVGLELFMFSPGTEAQLQASLASYSGPYWDAPSAFFTLRSEAAREEVLAAITAQPALGVAVTQLLPSATGSSSVTAASSASSDVSAPAAIAASGSSEPQQQQQQQQQQQAQHVAVGQLLEASGGWLGRVMLAWQLGKVSNFDYLLYLNLAAGRSFNDLAQWPVFPWVLKDYSSSRLDLSDEAVFRDLTKPMGAQTPARLEVFRQRYHEMDVLAQHEEPGGHMPAPFMYGTHYSTPGYVMFWLVRAAPAHMLRLQGGRFDAPDRLFNSLGESWNSATSSTTDVKELIPEFFMPGGDFLVNGSQLALGIRQSGQPVADVVLPPWAGGPEELLALHRAALEAPYVSANLHHWIDLIFGHKQRGPAAVDADNVFYHLTYEGAVDISTVTSLQELKALETQINEFGQTPKQLFTHPHPARLVQPAAPDPATVFNHTSSSNSSSNSSKQLMVKKSLRLQPEPLTAVAALSDGHVVVAGHSGLLRVLEAPQLSTVRSVKLSEEDLLCLSLLPAAPSAHRPAAAAAAAAAAGAARGGATVGTGVGSSTSGVPNSAGVDVHLPLVLAGSQTGRVFAYAAIAGQPLGSFAPHNDAVSSMLLLGHAGGRLATASWDCTVKVWDVGEGRQPWASTLPLPSAELALESGCWALSGSASGQLLVTGTDEGTVAAWDLRTQQQIWATQVSADYVGGLSLLPGGNYVAAAAADGSMNLLEWRRGGLSIASASCASPLRCCACDGSLMIAGSEAGQLLMWSLAQLTGPQAGTGAGGGAALGSPEAVRGGLMAGPDGLYPPVSCPSRAAVNGVGVAVTGSGGSSGSCSVLAAMDDGLLVLFSN
ncbi:hypothetical protein OEZ86_001912 [Tetradesmus obliquus]|nr:hypothetical protein OEZ86_001912 [Tetradesmus obliquus]